MTADLRARCHAALSAMLSRRWADGKHLANCRRGMWVDGYTLPDGAPCSKRCAAVRALIVELEGPQQLEMIG